MDRGKQGEGQAAQLTEMSPTLISHILRLTNSMARREQKTVQH